jgi:hypothetical protein
MNYKIVEETNSVTGEKRFIVKTKNLFWWSTCRRELGWNCDVPAVFIYKESAEDYIKSRQIEDGWRTT